jgi:mercuric ion transport protein
VVRLAAGGLAAILASTCCLGPLVLVALGFSGAWIGNLTVLEPYRPIFIGAALVALFFAWRRIFRPAHACKPGEVCAIPQVRTTYKLIFWIVAAWWWSRSPFPTSCRCSTDQEIIMKKLCLTRGPGRHPCHARLGRHQTVTLSVPGMTCAACPITVKKALSKVEGVSQVDVSFEKREAVVTFDDAKTSVQKLTKATTNAGYPSSVKR